MPRTYCIAHMKFIDITALDDSSVSVNQSSFAKMDLFKEDSEAEQDDYGTLELNQFVLDGSKDILTSSPTDIAFWSKKSNQNCAFAVNPAVTILFSEPHTSAGLTLHFVDDYPAELKVSFYDSNNTSIGSITVVPDGFVTTVKKQVSSYYKIKIEFTKTRFPYQYVKLQYIDYGLILEWEDALISDASIHEEVDNTGNTLAINTATISIIDENYDFDVSNENGAWKSIQKTQEVTLNEYKDNQIIPVGTFFINTNSFSDNVATFNMIDRIGLMDKYKFSSNGFYENERAETILEAIFEACGVEKYDIDEEVKDILLSGYIDATTCREALKMVCFSCNALADDSRSDTVKVFKPSKKVSSTIGVERKFSGHSKVQLDSYVSGVSITCQKYVLSEETGNIYDDELPAGTSVIELSNPIDVDSVTCESGTVTDVTSNSITVTMAEAGQCVIKGKSYGKTDFTFSKNVDEIPSGESENIINYSGITVYNTDIIQEKLSDLLDFHTLRKKLSMQYLIDDESVGDWVNVTDVNGNISTTLISSQDIDLSGGFISTTSCIGYSIVLSNELFCGTELIAGNGGLL